MCERCRVRRSSSVSQWQYYMPRDRRATIDYMSVAASKALYFDQSPFSLKQEESDPS